jgi:hypothetical protein
MEPRELTSVDINTPTLRTMQLLVQHGRSAVAVLSPDGHLITNLSSSDLRCTLCTFAMRLPSTQANLEGWSHAAVASLYTKCFSVCIWPRVECIDTHDCARLVQAVAA